MYHGGLIDISVKRARYIKTISSSSFQVFGQCKMINGHFKVFSLFLCSRRVFYRYDFV